VADSSYWLYLAHMPVILVFQMALARTGWPPIAKLFVVLGAAIPVWLCSYHYLVRPTWLGAILNGRRSPIGRRTGWEAGTSMTLTT
jgi:hypothetical protein